MKGFQSINKRLSVRFFIWALLSHLLVHQLIGLPVGLLLLVVWCIAKVQDQSVTSLPLPTCMLQKLPCIRPCLLTQQGQTNSLTHGRENFWLVSSRRQPRLERATRLLAMFIRSHCSLRSFALLRFLRSLAPNKRTLGRHWKHTLFPTDAVAF